MTTPLQVPTELLRQVRYLNESEVKRLNQKSVQRVLRQMQDKDQTDSPACGIREVCRGRRREGGKEGGREEGGGRREDVGRGRMEKGREFITFPLHTATSHFHSPSPLHFFTLPLTLHHLSTSHFTLTLHHLSIPLSHSPTLHHLSTSHSPTLHHNRQSERTAT